MSMSSLIAVERLGPDELEPSKIEEKEWILVPEGGRKEGREWTKKCPALEKES